MQTRRSADGLDVHSAQAIVDWSMHIAHKNETKCCLNLDGVSDGFFVKIKKNMMYKILINN